MIREENERKSAYFNGTRVKGSTAPIVYGDQAALPRCRSYRCQAVGREKLKTGRPSTMSLVDAETIVYP